MNSRLYFAPLQCIAGRALASVELAHLEIEAGLQPGQLAEFEAGRVQLRKAEAEELVYGFGCNDVEAVAASSRGGLGVRLRSPPDRPPPPTPWPRATWFQPCQVRAGRAMLHWSPADLANASGLPARRLAAYEAETLQLPPAEIRKIGRALFAGGVKALAASQSGVGVQLTGGRIDRLGRPLPDQGEEVGADPSETGAGDAG